MKYKLILITLGLMSLSACGRATTTTDCNELDAVMVAKTKLLTAGVSTQAETQAVFGTPTKTSAQEDEYVSYTGCKTYWTIFSDGKFLALASK